MGGIALLVLHINRGIVTTWTYELPIMFFVAYTLPAFAWFATLFSPETSTKQSYRTIYFCSHFAVEAYAFIVPVLRLHSQWNNPASVVPVHSISKLNWIQGTITVKAYLIISCCVTFILMLLTTYITCCLTSYSRRYVSSELRDE